MFVIILFLFSASIVGFIEIKVKKESVTYNKIVELNETTSFHKIEPIIIITGTLNSKKDFDNIKFDSVFQEPLKKEEHNASFDLVIKQASENKQKWKEYTDKLFSLDIANTKINNNTRLPNYIYEKVERKIINDIKLEKPVFDPTVRVVKTYTSPAGRNTYEDSKDYTLEDINKHREYLDEKDKKERAYKESVEYQRSLMTPSLRYDILKRDDFRCQICGHSQEDGVKLHVDHILPIAKGGETKEENLRALCSNCNIGKSAKYDPKGVN